MLPSFHLYICQHIFLLLVLFQQMSSHLLKYLLIDKFKSINHNRCSEILNNLEERFIVDLYEENTKEEIISKLENKFTAEQIEEAYDEITSLKEEGLLFTTDTYEFNPNFVNRKKVVKSLCLHVSHDCNLRCKYCFA